MEKILAQKNEFLTQYPHLAEEIEEFAQLALDEIEDGSSPNQELVLFIGEIQNLINE